MSFGMQLRFRRTCLKYKFKVSINLKNKNILRDYILL